MVIDHISLPKMLIVQRGTYDDAHHQSIDRSTAAVHVHARCQKLTRELCLRYTPRQQTSSRVHVLCAVRGPGRAIVERSWSLLYCLQFSIYAAVAVQSYIVLHMHDQLDWKMQQLRKVNRRRWPKPNKGMYSASVGRVYRAAFLRKRPRVSQSTGSASLGLATPASRSPRLSTDTRHRAVEAVSTKRRRSGSRHALPPPTASRASPASASRAMAKALQGRMGRRDRARADPEW
jgi:hypothetical protein